MQELDQINNFIEEVGDEVEVKWGASYDDTLGDEVRVTVIATGYRVNDIPGIEDCEEKPREEIIPAEKPTIEQAIKKFYDDEEKSTEDAQTVQETQEVEEHPQTEEPKATENIEDLEDNSNTASASIPAPEAEEEHAVEIVNDGNASEPIDIIFDLNDSDEQTLEETPSWTRRR